MNTIKRFPTQNFPIKLNYKSNDTLLSYRGGKSASNLQKINDNKNKIYLEEKKSNLSKNSKNTSFLFSDKNIKNQNKKNDIKISSINSYNNNNYNFQFFIDNIMSNNKYSNYNTNYYSYKTKANNNYNSNFFWNENSNNSYNNSKCNTSSNNNNNSNINYNPNNNYNYKINNNIFSQKRSNINDKTIFNKKQIYQKPKNERSLSSYSIAITDYNTNTNKSKENISIKSYYNIDVSNFNNKRKNVNNNNRKNNYLAQRYTDITRCINSTFINPNNYLYNNESKNNKKMFDERRTNIDYSKLNLHSPKEYQDINYNFNYNNNQKDIHYTKRNRTKIKSDIINHRINDNMNLSCEKRYKTNFDNCNSYSFIYIRKNSSNKSLINNNNNINKSSLKTNNNYNIIKINNHNSKDKNKIRVNMKQRNILENAYFVQNKVILIQKNYRMHLGRLKKYILITIKKIIEGSNKLYFIFYKNYCRKFLFILNNGYIKSIDINIKTRQIIPKIRKINTYNNINNNNNNTRSNYSYIMNNRPQKKAITYFTEKLNFNSQFCNSQKCLIDNKLKNTDSSINKIKKDMVLIRNLKNQIVKKLNMLKK